MVKEKYKICFITTIPLTLRAFVISSAEYLYQTGRFDITFICDEDKEFAHELPKHFRYYPISMKRGISLLGIRACYQMFCFFRKEKFDLVQYSTPNASLYASIAAKYACIPNRLYCQWGIAYVGFRGLKRWIFKMVEKYVCFNSTQIEPDSNGNRNFSIKEHLYSEYKSSVIGYGSASGVDLRRFNRLNKEKYRKEIRTKYKLQDAFVFGFVGRLDKDKGVDELFEAFFNCQVNNRKLLVIGANDKIETLNQKILLKAHQNQDIIFIGATREVEKFLSAMDILILPSYREGFGSVIIEALAMEVPVIATDIIGPQESVQKEHGLLVPCKDVEALKQAMEKMALNSDLTAMQKAGYQFVLERFDSKFVHEEIYKDRMKLLEGK